MRNKVALLFAFGLGMMLFYGGTGLSWGAEKEMEQCETVQKDRIAAEQGDADAQNRLGMAYIDGEGVEQDFTEAVKWFRLAAEQGYADAQEVLGTLYLNGNGVPCDRAEAVKWLRKAAGQGSESAKEVLAQL